MRRLLLCLALMFGMMSLIAVAASPALASPTTHTTAMTLAGTSGLDNLGGISIQCDDCVPDDDGDVTDVVIDCGGCVGSAGAIVTAKTSVDWTAPLKVDTTVDPGDLSQGNNADVNNVATPQAGTLSITYHVHYVAGLFGCGGVFPSCSSGWFPFSPDTTTSGDIDITRSASCAIPLPGAADASCAAPPDSISIVKDFPDPSFPVDVSLDIVINHTFTVTPGGLVLNRTASFAAPAALSFAGSPSSASDSIDVPCSASVGDAVNYALTGATYSAPSVKVDGSIGLHYFVDGPGPLNAEDTIPIASGTVFAGGLTMHGGAAPSFSLGSVLPDNQPPVISGIIQGGTFQEGAPVSFLAVVGDNCAAGLADAWQFSDGGTAFGVLVSHVFDDNGNYTGLLKATDAAGNTDLQTFAVKPIANVAPDVIPPPDATAYWGVPISFHADAVDAGSADQPTLSFHWNFGDGAGAAGTDVSHAYSTPGVYSVGIAVTDKDGGVGNGAMKATVDKRPTALVYNGPTQSTPAKWVTLSASLSDALNQAVVARAITLAVGAQSGPGTTDSSGIGTTTLKLNQQKGTYPVGATFAGDSLYLPATSPAATFLIGEPKKK